MGVAINMLKRIERNYGNLLGIVEIDSFNSQNFGLNMGNLELSYDSKKEINCSDYKNLVNELLNLATIENYEHITVKIDTDVVFLTKPFIENNFQMTDTLVTYKYNYDDKLKPIQHRVILDDCTDDDIERLAYLAQNAFKYDRFHSDESLDSVLCDEYYKKWIINSYNGFADRVIVAYKDGIPVGFTTAKLPASNAGIGRGVLSAVDESCRGLGIYTSMIHELIRWMEGKAKEVTVGTQINNYAVQKAWAKLGFRISESKYIFQKKIK